MSPALLVRLCRRVQATVTAVWMAALLGVQLAAVAPAHAGQNCDPQPPDTVAVQQSLELAERTARALDGSGASVVVLARAGQDLGRYGLRWSHLGYAYRAAAPQGPGLPGVWRVVHKLNHCGTAESALYRQGLAEFFLDRPNEYAAAYTVLAPALQHRLLPLLRDDGRIARLHSPHYSMVAYPWAVSYQQSNQWALETLAWAEDPAADRRERAQAWLRLKGYEPSTLHLGALTRLGARLTRAHVAFDDHPPTQRYGGRIETVTVDSVFAWLMQSGLAQPVQIVR